MNQRLPQYQPESVGSSSAETGGGRFGPTVLGGVVPEFDHHTGNRANASQKTVSFILNQFELLSGGARGGVGSSAALSGSGRRSVAISAVYVHVPFCFHKCHYCDFYSIVDSQDRQSLFVDRLIEEIAAYSGCFQWGHEVGGATDSGIAGGAEILLDSIFIGGGTPTLLRVPLWSRLLAALREHFGIGNSTEFTVEANPETLSAELAECLIGGGVNRLSVGAQSFDRVHLKTLERWHDPESVPRAFEVARAAGFRNLSLDLIFGIPGQSLSDWIVDLETALALEPTHLSCYALTYEPNTALTKRRDAGMVTPIDEDIEAEMFLETRVILKRAGFEAYEISNFALVGELKSEAGKSDFGKDGVDGQAVAVEGVDYRCRHNLAYWRNENWLGLGPAAAGHLGGYRYRNVPHLQTYLRTSGASESGGGDLRVEAAGFPPIEDVECGSAATVLAERMLMGLRLAEGMDLDELLAAAAEDSIGRGAELAAAVRYEVAETGRLVICEGLMDRRGVRSGRIIKLSEDEGLLFADTVIGNLMGAVEREDDCG